MAESEKRKGMAPVPINLDRYLTPAQVAGLDRALKYGWSVKFVRRPTIVLEYEGGSILGVLEEDGSLNKNHSIRERAPRTAAND
jgi:hypothetical protein